MKRSKLVYGDIALISGSISISLIILPSIGFHQFLGGIKNVYLSLLFGIVGLVTSIIQSKTHQDQLTRAALICNSIGIIIAVMKGIIILIR